MWIHGYTHIYVIYLSTATVNHHTYGHFRWVTKTLQRHQHMSSLTISLWPLQPVSIGIQFQPSHLNPIENHQVPNRQIHGGPRHRTVPARCQTLQHLRDWDFWWISFDQLWMESMGKWLETKSSAVVWLVVGPPLWKIWTSIGMMRFPILMGK